MADIERRLLARQDAAPGSDEDGSERLRAAANGDVRESETADDGAGHAPPAAPRRTHTGPQTGVKGVLADYHHSQREHRRRLEQAARPAAIAAAAPAPAAEEEEDGDADSDSEIDRILGGDGDESARFFDDYRAKRMGEQSRAAAQAGLGVLRDASPDEYVDAVDRWAAAGAHVAAVLVDQGRAAQRLDEYIGAEAARFPHTAFLRVQAAQCGFSDPAVVPMLLVYRHGELRHNLVRVVDSFPDPLQFERRDVARLLDRLLHR
ncbi:hypothetical protein H4R21_003553 [Coemansia helicoidea]|uniref:Uncharacterized protein n=1 Tax=Coemansia helicoidea TaxID=1286919 RepID=A0ACC1L2Y3_9FUNG|nr:hypothetical protein H4R21_003553 [Coemansia helicoidea]